MSPNPQPATAPRVAAILVVHNGEEWLPSVLATLARARYPALDVVAVNSGSTDGSRALLERRLPADRILDLPRNAGFGRAVAAAVAHFDDVSSADFLLLLHDDVVLAPDALARLVQALVADPALAAVGPKLREWNEEPLLQQVGMTVDRLGRAESQLEPGELDQGQHDRQREVLYVSTAGMLLRLDAMRTIGGFDARFPAFRDDLDFCWRAWLSGMRVEVAPEAVAYHAGAASGRARPLGSDWEPRFLAERHTIATLLKNYSLGTLAWVMPLVVVLGVVKVLAFLATRRFGDAAATVAAYGWNLGQLPATLRRRRRVQSRRRVSDRALRRLFARGLPRVSSYVEAAGGWLAGGSTRALLDEAETEEEAVEAVGGLRALGRWVRARPVAAAGVVLTAAYLVGALPLLGPGQLVGGQVAPWPERAVAFLSAYAGPWSPESIASGAFPSPVQALLGAAAFAGLGSAWLAQRIVVLGLLPLAWLLAVRAGRLVTSRPVPRVLGATLYVLSPAVLGALADGRLGVLAVAAVLPGLVLVGVQILDRDPDRNRWRPAALLALGLALAGAAEASTLPLVVLLYVGLLVAAALPASDDGALRWVAGAGGAAALLLAPWLSELVRGGWAGLTPAASSGPVPLWRALGVVPDVLANLSTPGALLATLTAAAVVVAAVLFGMRTQPWAVAGLVSAWALSSLAAWALSLSSGPGMWPTAVLLPAALAQGGLGVLAARWLIRGLAGYAFGAPQLLTALLITVLVAGLGAGILRLAGGPWHGLSRDPELVPAFVAADAGRVGGYRILVLSHDEDGAVRWDVAEADGPDMTAYGSVPSPALVTFIDDAVGAAVGGADLSAGAALGVANVRYVVAPEAGASMDLVAALNRQPVLEPMPAGGDRVWRVRTWLPRAGVLPADRGEALLAAGDPGDTVDLDGQGLAAVEPGRYAGDNPRPDGGLLVVSEAGGRAWKASANGTELEPVEVDPVRAFRVPAGAGRIDVRLSGRLTHGLAAAMQVLLALALLSLAVRPPGSGVPARRAGDGALPAALTADDDAPPAGAPGAYGDDLVVPVVLRAQRAIAGSEPPLRPPPGDGPPAGGPR